MKCHIMRHFIWSLLFAKVQSLGSTSIEMVKGLEINPFKYSIRIYHECEGRIEKKSVQRIAVWHHKAYQGTDFSILPSHE